VSCHLLAATPTAHWLEYVDWADAVLQEPLAVKKGMLHMAEGPGAGMAWDEQAVKRFAL
jgi:mandelate racemase